MLRPILAALVALLATGCVHLAPTTAGVPAAPPVPAFGTLPEAVQKERLRARTLKILEITSLPGGSFADAAIERVDAPDGLLRYDRGVQTVPPGAYWIVTVRGRWETPYPMPTGFCEVLETYQARHVFSAATAAGYGLESRSRGTPRMVPMAMLRIPTFAERERELAAFDGRP